MSRRILIVPDKFKGSLSAAAAAAAIAAGWARARPSDRLELLPMSDGGDGFGPVFGALLGALPRWARAVDAAHRSCSARWWWAGPRRTAVIESAGAIGLAMLPRGRFHPFDLDTRGLASVMRRAAAQGARSCLVGVGGSATNDGGFGLARALGWHFLDAHGRFLKRWTDLDRLARLLPPRQKRLFKEVIVAVDVRNPLLGPRGATRVYGPQKGLRPAEFARAESCLARLATVTRHELGRDWSVAPGAGAAGGLGFGLAAFLGARLEAGFDLFARLARLDQRLRQADLVVTGEGCLDESSAMGKGVGEIASRCRRFRVPCLALAGAVRARPRVFREIAALTDLTSAAEAQADAALWLTRLSELVAART